METNNSYEFNCYVADFANKVKENRLRLIELLEAAEDTLQWLKINHRASEPEFFGNLKTAIHNAKTVTQ